MQQVAPTETGTIVVVVDAAPSAIASVAPEPIASSAPSASVGATPPAPTKSMLELTGNQEGHAPEDSFLRGRTVHVPQVRLGTTTVTGKLPREVVQRIVRQHFAMFRFCYEDGLRKNPNLQGRITTKFVIGTDGNVTTAQDAGSDLADQNVVQCVVKKFGTFSYPKPEDGIVSVVFPLIFAPGE